MAAADMGLDPAEVAMIGDDAKFYDLASAIAHFLGSGCR